MTMLQISRRAIDAFAPGDLSVVVLFVLVGEISHGVLPWVYPVLFAETAITFLAGWIVVSPLVWAYRDANLREPVMAIGTAVGAWIGATLVANGLRATELFHGNAAVSFILVAAGFGGVLMAGWRYLRVRTIAG